MSIFLRDDGKITEIVESMLLKYHQPLHDAKITVDVLLAYAKTDKNGDAVGAALKHGGYQAAAVVKIVKLSDRVKGNGDAEITVDGDRWPEWSLEQQEALIDHELEHLDIVVDKDGVLKRDDAGRPKLKIRLHDRQLGWFDSIARRHGPASFEVFQAAKFAEADELWQLYFPGFDVAKGERPSKAPRIAGEARRNVSDEEQAKVDGHVRNIRRGGEEIVSVSFRGGPQQEMTIEKAVDTIVTDATKRLKGGRSRRAAASR